MKKFNTVGIPHQIDGLQRVMRGSQRWYKCPNGGTYPSVTTVLGDVEKPGLEAWRQMLGTKAADKETKRASDRGTAMHEMAEKYLMNVENPTKGYQPSDIKLFNQIKVRLNKIDNIRGQELQMYSERLRLAGTADCIGEYDGTLSLIDFKSSTNVKGEDLVYDYFLQCTAYALMYFEHYDEPIENIVIIMGVEKGMVPMVFTGVIDDYVQPLLQRINTFYEKVEN